MRLLPTAILAVITFLSGYGIAQQRISAARDFLEKNRIFRGDVQRPKDYAKIRAIIKAKPDPESKFGYILFSIVRQKSLLLSRQQAEQLSALTQKHITRDLNWHDVRNIVRVQAVIAMWEFATEKNESRAALLKAEWENWTDLRLAYMFQEFVEKERFQRSAWEILSPKQRQDLLQGDWDSYIKKSEGHGRLFSADKQARRALGKPDNKIAFDKATQAWRIKWEPMWKKYWQASRFQNRREFSMDEANEEFALASWDEYATAFRAFVEYERDAVRDIVQAGYVIDSDIKEATRKIQEKLRSETIEKYRPHAPDFLLFPGKRE